MEDSNMNKVKGLIKKIIKGYMYFMVIVMIVGVLEIIYLLVMSKFNNESSSEDKVNIEVEDEKYRQNPKKCYLSDSDKIICNHSKFKVYYNGANADKTNLKIVNDTDETQYLYFISYENADISKDISQVIAEIPANTTKEISADLDITNYMVDGKVKIDFMHTKDDPDSPDGEMVLFTRFPFTVTFYDK